ncbi:MAG: MoxR family ATPase [Kiritimatiellae bacterium]|nr:MoxR family ATPase [Kiritimatiellia bacterium]
MTSDLDALNERVRQAAETIGPIREAVGSVIVGQEYLIDRLLVGLLANGHLLLEGVPGLAKTLSVRMLAAAIRCEFRRIQFTPDLLPADLVGTLIFDPKNGAFTTRKGPVFTHIVLADEINRAPAKVQSALLEAMQERQVTIGEETFPLPRPFLVLATQNPIEQEGIYPLPEAQIDRFMLKLRITYPSLEEEGRILDAMAVTAKTICLAPVAEPDAVLAAQQVVDGVYLDAKIRDYILRLVFATRDPDAYGLPLKPYIRYGCSPRGTICLAVAAKAYALLRQRAYVTPQDVKAVAPDVLRHRLIVSYEAEAEELTADNIVARILEELPVP